MADRAHMRRTLDPLARSPPNTAFVTPWLPGGRPVSGHSEGFRWGFPHPAYPIPLPSLASQDDDTADGSLEFSIGTSHRSLST
nr:putative integron gene cassette protein [uncultured bacterium]